MTITVHEHIPPEQVTQQRIQMVHKSPIFKEILESLGGKADAKSIPHVMNEIHETNRKIQTMKEAIKRKIDNIAEEAAEKKMNALFDSYKNEVKQQISQKCDRSELTRELATKADRAVVDNKAESSDIIKLLERYDRFV